MRGDVFRGKNFNFTLGTTGKGSQKYELVCVGMRRAGMWKHVTHNKILKQLGIPFKLSDEGDILCDPWVNSQILN